MSRALRDPRIRLVLAVAILVLAVALSWHLVAMGLHGMAMMLGLCLAVLSAVGVVLLGGPAVALVSPPLPGPVGRPTAERVEALGRHPPEEGIRLRR